LGRDDMGAGVCRDEELWERLMTMIADDCR